MESELFPNKLHAIIIDDELHGRENLKYLLENYCPEVEVVGLAASVFEASKAIKSLKPDIVFLDINMPLLDGFDFLNEFEDRSFKVVIVSAHDNFGIPAVKSGVVDYILKPISIKELKLCIKKLTGDHKRNVVFEAQTNDKTLMIPALHGFEVIDIESILCLEADGSYTTIKLANGTTKVVSRTLKEFEDSLPKSSFCRIHKSHLINILHVKDYTSHSGSSVTLIDGSVVSISRRKVNTFMEKARSMMKRL